MAEPVLVIHVDADHTDLALIREGRLLFSRWLGQGAQEWGQGGADAVMEEIDYSMATVRKELPGAQVMALLLTGLGQLDRWQGVLQQRWGKPVALKLPHGRLSLPKDAALDASPASALGLALADANGLIDLAPPQLRRTQRARRRRRVLALTGSLAAAVLTMGSAGLWLSAQRQERRVEHLSHEVRRLDAAAREVARGEQAAALARQSQERRRRLAEMVAALFQRMPPELSFESVVFEQTRGTLTVRGTAPSVRVVLDYLKTLEQSGPWRQVALRSATRRAAGQPRTAFEAVLQ